MATGKRLILNIECSRFSRRDTSGVLRRWNKKKNDGKMDNHCLANIAKKVDPDGYKQWLEKYEMLGSNKMEIPENCFAEMAKEPTPAPAVTVKEANDSLVMDLITPHFTSGLLCFPPRLD